jgi:hypothetical protein
MTADHSTPPASRRLSDARLERLLDGALPSDHPDHAALASSPADRARLDEIRAADDRALEALLAPRPRVAPRAGRRYRFAFAGIAASVALIAGVFAWLSATRPVPGPGPGPAAPPAPVAVAHVPAPYEPVRVIFAIPIRPAASPHAAPSDAVTKIDPPASPSDVGRAVTFALTTSSDEGVRQAVSAIKGAQDQDRTAALAALRQSLRSGTTAVRILDQLDPSDQVAVCGELALDQGLRAVALQRLRELVSTPAGPDVRATVRTLAAAPGMKAWLRSYGLLEPDGVPAAAG